MSRTKSAVLGVISSQIFTIISIFVNIIATPLILKKLNSEIYGLSIIIFQITAYLGMFDFGLTAGVERFLAGSRGDDEATRRKIEKIICTAFVVYGILGFLVAVTGNILAPFASKIFNIPLSYKNETYQIISILSILIGLQFLLRTISGIFFAHQKQVLSNSLSFFLNLSNTVLLIIFIHFGFQLWSFVYSQIFVFIINSCLNIYFFRKHYHYVVLNIKNFDRVLLKEMFSYGFFLFIIGIAVQVVFQTDRILIGSLISLTAVSVYSLTTKIPELSSQLLWKITDNSFPALVELSKTNDNSFKLVHNNLMQITLSFSTVGFWIILLISYPFIKLWVGADYYAGFKFTSIVTYLYLIQLTFIHVTSVFLNSAGIAKKIAYSSLLEAALNLGLSFILAKSMGITGVVIATIIAGCLTSFWYVPYLTMKYLDYNFISYFTVLIKPIIGCSLFCFMLYLLFKDIFLNINNWFSLIVYTLLILALSVIPLVFLNKNLFIELKNKIFQRQIVLKN